LDQRSVEPAFPCCRLDCSGGAEISDALATSNAILKNMALTFEWDPKKAVSNLAKHGVSFEEATGVFADANALTIPDPLHSGAEHRQITMGRTLNSKILVVVHTERGDNLRIISARRANPREKKTYAAAS